MRLRSALMEDLPTVAGSAAPLAHAKPCATTEKTSSYAASGYKLRAMQ